MQLLNTYWNNSVIFISLLHDLLLNLCLINPKSSFRKVKSHTPARHFTYSVVNIAAVVVVIERCNVTVCWDRKVSLHSALLNFDSFPNLPLHLMKFQIAFR